MAPWDKTLSGPINHKATGVQYYILPAGSIIYHGTTCDVWSDDIMNRPNFFALKMDAYAYSVQTHETRPGETPNLWEFVTARPLRLVAMDQCQTISALIKNRIFKNTRIREAYLGCDKKQTTPKRYSTHEIDHTFVKHFCKMRNFDGYVSHDMPSLDGGVFHAEMYICDTRGALVNPKRVFMGIAKRNGVCRRPRVSAGRR